MADSKYADLPGIAKDQPDVYETSDLPESDQNTVFYEEDSDSIERLHISASEAFTKFKGKSLSTSSVDFSDRLSRHRRIGYDARSGDWELVGTGEKETPLQKYQRLQCEMKELLEEISKYKDEAKDEQAQGENSCIVLASQVEKAQEQLTDLKLEETLGCDLITDLADPHGSQLKKVFTLIEAFKENKGPAVKSSTATKKAASGDNAVLTYKLNFRPEHARLGQTARIAELERRLHRLEAVVGADPDKLSRLALDTQHKSLLELTHSLNAKIGLLDSSQLDQVEGRLSSLAHKMDSVAEKTIGSQDPEHAQKVLELYDMTKKVESLSQVLPNVLQRMTALESLHQQAANVSKSLAQLEALQQQVISGLQNNDMLLKKVQLEFGQNMDAIKKNMGSLDTRIAALSK